jgi:hypothetical protein
VFGGYDLMDGAQLDELNRRLALSAVPYGFVATARAFEVNDTQWFELTAAVWANGRLLEYTEDLLVCELEAMGAGSIANRFLKLARRILPPRTEPEPVL